MRTSRRSGDKALVEGRRVVLVSGILTIEIVVRRRPGQLHGSSSRATMIAHRRSPCRIIARRRSVLVPHTGSNRCESRLEPGNQHADESPSRPAPRNALRRRQSSSGRVLLDPHLCLEVGAVRKVSTETSVAPDSWPSPHAGATGVAVSMRMSARPPGCDLGPGQSAATGRRAAPQGIGTDLAQEGELAGFAGAGGGLPPVVSSGAKVGGPTAGRPTRRPGALAGHGVRHGARRSFGACMLGPLCAAAGANHDVPLSAMI
jgi:hypothetical protein